MMIRPATAADHDAIWLLLEPMLREGETFALARDMSRDDAVSYWTGADKQTFVAVDDDRIAGTYYLRANHPGGGAHVANCGYVTGTASRGRGVARAMGLHSIAEARRQGFSAIQFNFVVSSNETAVRLWTSLGFGIVGRLPGAFRHPRLGDVDALIMFRSLEPSG
jgi:ribosomal protein S18 acetylase RimI-like enzyme